MAERVAEIIVDKDDIITLRADVQLNLHDLVDSLTQDQLFKLIVGLDAQVAEWSFTERLYAHFAAAHEEYLGEVKRNAKR